MGRSKEQRRNWVKFLVSGIQGEADHLLSVEGEILSEYEQKELIWIREKAANLADNWEKGNKEVLGSE